jgi:hypothetical protein
MDPYAKLTSSLSKIQSDFTTDLLSAGYVLGIIIGIIGLALLISGLATIIKIYRINKWPVTKNAATVRDSFMETSSSNVSYSILIVSQSHSNTMYRTRGSFTYQVNNQTYISNKISYYEPWQSNPIIPKIENGLLKKGELIDLRINPKNPTEAYIFNNPYDKPTRIFISILLILLGSYVIIKIIFSTKKND